MTINRVKSLLSTEAVNPLGTNLTMGIICEERETFLKPTDFAISATFNSCSSNVYECIRATAKLEMPEKLNIY
jgi:hypothetical protein